MAEAKLIIGGRRFRVACDDGQEALLQSAAALMDQYAKSILTVNDEISETQLLLMTGLLVADQAKASEKENVNLQAYHKDLEARLNKVEDRASVANSKELKERQKELDATKEHLAHTQKDLQKNEEKLSRAIVELKVLNSENKNLRAQVQEGKAHQANEDRLSQTQQENEKLRAELAGYDSLKEKNESLNKRVVELTQKNERLEADKSTQIASNGDQLARTRDLEEALKKRAEEIQVLKAQNLELTTQIEAFGAGGISAEEELEREREEFKTRTLALEDENKALKLNLSKVNSHRQALLKQIERLNSETVPTTSSDLDKPLSSATQRVSEVNKADVEPAKKADTKEAAKSQNDNNRLMNELISGLERLAKE